MNSVLSYIAAFIVVVLFAALIGPSFVDWNSFRGEIESRLSEATGWQAEVSGDIHFVLLPAPRFQLGGLSLREADAAAEAAPLADIGSVEGEVALAPLLRGDVEVTHVRLSDFSLNVTVDEDGRLDWTSPINVSDPGADSYVDPKSVSLTSAQLERGTLQYRDLRSGREVSFAGINGTFSAASLQGPLRADVAFTQGGAKGEVELAVGEFAGTKAFPVTAALSYPEISSRLSFSGIATEFSRAGRLDGAFQAQAGMKEKGEPLVNVNAGLVAGENEARLRTLVADLPGGTLKGEAVLSLTGTPRAALDLSAVSLTLDPYFAGPETGEAVAGLLSYLPADMDFEAAIKADGVLYRERSAKELSAQLMREEGVWRLTEAALKLPHDARLEMRGRRSEAAGGKTRYDGTFNLRAPNAHLFSSWLAGTAPVNGNGGATALNVEGTLALSDTLWQFYNIEAALGPAGESGAVEENLRGGFSLARVERQALSIEAHGRDVDLTPLAPLLALLPEDPREMASERDISLVTTGQNVTFEDWQAAELDAEAALRQGALAIDHVHLADPSGASLSLSGRLAGIEDEPLGALQGRIDAPQAGTSFFGLVDEDWQKAGYAPLSVYFEAQAEAGDDGAGHFTSIDLEGRVAESSLKALIKRRREKEGKAFYDGVLSLTNESSAALLRQLGFAPGAEVSENGELRLQGAGEEGGSYEVGARLTANGFHISSKGKLGGALAWPPEKFDGRVDISAPRLEALVQGFGWNEGEAAGLMRLLTRNGAGGGVVAGGDVALEEGAFQVEGLEAVAGTFRTSGTLGWKMAAGETPGHLSGNIELSRLSLDPVFAEGVAPGDVWPTAPLDWSALGDFTAELNVKADLLELAGLRIGEAESRASVESGVLSLTPFTGTFADSRLTMGMRFEGGESEPGIGVTLSLESADAAQATGLALGESAGRGELGLSLQMEGKGRSWLALVSSLGGSGQLLFENGVFNGFDLDAFSMGLAELEDIEDFAALKERTLEEGQTAVTRIAAPLNIEQGLVQTVDAEFDIPLSPGAAGKTYIDLPRLHGDTELTLPLPAPEGVPALGFVSAGPLRALQSRFDSVAVEAFMARRLLEKQIEDAGVEDLPEDLKELIETPEKKPEAAPETSNGAEAANDNAPAIEGASEAPNAPRPQARPDKAS